MHKKHYDQRWTKAQEYEVNHWKKLLKNKRPLDWYSWKAKELEIFLIDNGFAHVLEVRKSKVLEIGSGPVGTVSAWPHGDRFAVEPLYEVFEESTEFKKYREFPVSYVEGVGENIPFPDKYFNLIIIDNVLDHTRNPKQVLSEAGRVLKDDGIIYLSLNIRSKLGLRIRDFLEEHFEFDKGHPHSFDLIKLMNTISASKLSIRAERMESYLDSFLRNLKENPLRTLGKLATGTSEKLYEALISH